MLAERREYSWDFFLVLLGKNRHQHMYCHSRCSVCLTCCRRGPVAVHAQIVCKSVKCRLATVETLIFIVLAFDCSAGSTRYTVKVRTEKNEMSRVWYEPEMFVVDSVRIERRFHWMHLIEFNIIPKDRLVIRNRRDARFVWLKNSHQ